MLFPTAKKMNLKVSVSPILNLWKRFWISIGHEFVGKKTRPSKSSEASCSERESIFCISAFKKAALTICW